MNIKIFLLIVFFVCLFGTSLIGEQKQNLHFAGAKSAMYLYINEHFTGYSQVSKTPAEFDITPLCPGR
jgi:beta-galactosidase/beta-glucuronidase